MLWRFTVLKFLIEEGNYQGKITVMRHTQTLWEKVRLGGGRGKFRTACGRGDGSSFYAQRDPLTKIFICFLPLVNWTNVQCPEYANVIANKRLVWRGGNERVRTETDCCLILWQDTICMEENLPNTFASKVPICLSEAKQGKASYQRKSADPKEPPSTDSYACHFSWFSVLLRRGDLRVRSLYILMLFF